MVTYGFPEHLKVRLPNPTISSGNLWLPEEMGKEKVTRLYVEYLMLEAFRASHIQPLVKCHYLKISQ